MTQTLRVLEQAGEQLAPLLHGEGLQIGVGVQIDEETLFLIVHNKTSFYPWFPKGNSCTETYTVLKIFQNFICGIKSMKILRLWLWLWLW